MKPEWKVFLLRSGAEMEGDEQVGHFGNPQREMSVAVTGDVFCDLSHQGLIGVYGDDAGSFLQGQFTVDVRRVDEQHSFLGAYCTPKGRMLASFRIFRRGQTLYLNLPREQVQGTLKRLSMYVLRARVTLEDAHDALVRIGASGPGMPRQLEKALGVAPPAEIDQVIQHEGMTVIRIRGIHPRFEIHGSLEQMTRLWDALNVHSAPVGAARWSLLDILAGVPRIHTQNVEAFLPQMANLQLLDGVSFSKGCYPGQEVVARAHYLGKLKRRMYLIELPLDQPPEPGTPLVDPGLSAEEQVVGNIVEAQLHPDDCVKALAVLKIESAEAGKLHLGAADGPPAKVQSLPYGFEHTAHP